MVVFIHSRHKKKTGRKSLAALCTFVLQLDFVGFYMEAALKADGP